MDASEGKKEAETTAGTMGQPDETENAVTDADTQDSTTEATTEEIQTVQKLETPDVKRLADDVRVLQYYDGTKWTLTAPVQDEDLVGTYESRAYRFEVQDGADYYEVQIKDASGAYGVLYVQPKTDKYYVYYAGSNAKIRRESLCEANPYTEFAGILTEEKTVKRKLCRKCTDGGYNDCNLRKGGCRKKSDFCVTSRYNDVRCSTGSCRRGTSGCL